jgi:hypothetical protein
MRVLRPFFIGLTIATAALAQECPELEAPRALYGVRQLMMEPYANTYTVGEFIDARLDELRDPLPGGGYRWVKFVRPSGDAPIEKREHLVSSDQITGEFETFEAEAGHPFAVRVVVPRKRSLLKANKDVYVGNVRIRYSVNGKEKTLEKKVNEWLPPDTSRSFDLGGIADHADASVEVATRSANVREALAEIHFRLAVAQDDPENPNAEAIASLKRIRPTIDPMTVDLEIGKLERRLFPGIDVIPFTTIGYRVREAEKLILSEKEEDQAKGKKMLTEVIRTLPR